jgi:hypothetical protein
VTKTRALELLRQTASRGYFRRADGDIAVQCPLTYGPAIWQRPEDRHYIHVPISLYVTPEDRRDAIVPHLLSDCEILRLATPHSEGA